MGIPLNAVQASSVRRKAANLQFVVGQDMEGHWVAMESHGKCGGIFVNREAAVKYAAIETRGKSHALRYAKKPLAIWK
jgi:hypothetical protein